MISDIPYGYCHCGCGEKTNLTRKGKPYKYIYTHHIKRRENHNFWKGGRTVSRGYIRILMPSHPRSNKAGYIPEHILEVEKVLGHFLPQKSEVHHIHEKGNNSHNNLVLCEDRHYHCIIHRRKNALISCGHANWRKCNICGQYDKPESLSIYHRKNRYEFAQHKLCASIKSIRYYQNKIGKNSA